MIFAFGSAAGVAYAASERYDSAKDNIDKAVALLKAINHADQSRAEKGHREHAIRQLEGALDQIAKAKVAADRPPPNGKGKDKDKKEHGQRGPGHEGHGHKGHTHGGHQH